MTNPPPPPSDAAPETPPVQHLTEDQAHQIAKTLYEPYLRRMSILLDTLITMTQNGDFVLWAPLTLLERQLGDLRWPAEHPERPERLLALISLVLRRFAERMDVYRSARQAAREAGAPMPVLSVWTNDDAMACYDEIDATFPLGPAPATSAGPAGELLQPPAGTTAPAPADDGDGSEPLR